MQTMSERSYCIVVQQSQTFGNSQSTHDIRHLHSLLLKNLQNIVLMLNYSSETEILRKYCRDQKRTSA